MLDHATNLGSKTHQKMMEREKKETANSSSFSSHVTMLHCKTSKQHDIKLYYRFFLVWFLFSLQYNAKSANILLYTFVHTFF